MPSEPSFSKTEQQKTIEINIAIPEDVANLLKVQYLAARENYPNETLGITIDDIDADYESSLTEEFALQEAERWRNMSEDSNQKYLVARVDGKVVGFCIVNKYSDKNQIMGFYISPEMQRQGVGKKLWEQAETYLDSTKVTTVMVLSYNELAKNFYRSLGFVETGNVANNGIGSKMTSGAIMPAPIEMQREIK